MSSYSLFSFILSLTFLFSLLSLFLSPTASFVGYAVDGLGRGYLARTIDSGASWIPVLRGPVNLSSVAFPTPNSLIAVGYNGCIIGSKASNGSIWSDPINVQFHYMTLIPSTTEQFRTVLFLSPLIGLAGGTRGILYRTVDGGSTWNSVSPPLLFRVVNYLFPVGSSIWALGNAGLLMKSLDQGVSWLTSRLNITYPGGKAKNLYCGSALNNQSFIVVGYGGTILLTNNGGNSFVSSYQSIGYDSSLALNSVHYYDSNTIYISGERGLLIRSLDGGISYKALNLSLSLTSARINSLVFLPASATRSMTPIGLPDSVIAVAAIRDRFLLTRFNDGSNWVESSPIRLNFIETIALLPAPVCYPTPKEFVIAAVSGGDIPFNILIQNTGTQDLIISSIKVSTSLIVLSSKSPSSLYAQPLEASTRFSFIFAAAGLARGVYTGVVQFLHNAPSGQTSVPIKVVVVQNPSVSEPSFFVQYWWALALGVLALFGFIAYFVRRRMRHIRSYNRRIRDPDLHLSFWRFWCCQNVQEHDSDSDFWLEQSDDGEEWDEEEEEEESEDSDGVNKKGKKRGDQSDSDSISDQDYSEKDVMKQILKNRFDVSESRDDESSVSRKSSNSRRQMRRLSMKPSSGASSAALPTDIPLSSAGPRKSVFVGALQSSKLPSSKKSN